MRKLFLAVIMLAAHQGFAQKIDASKVPADVVSTFKKVFPGTQAVKWEQEKGNYEANFKKNGEKMSALFNANGKWLVTETDIAVSALPAVISKYIATNYSGEKIKEAAILKMANGDTNYEAEVKGKDILFDGKGNFIKAAKD